MTKPNRVPLSQKAVDGLKPGAKQYDAWDLKLAGFGVRVSPAGTKTYHIYYRDKSTGKKCRHDIGRTDTITYDKAFAKAKLLLGGIELNGDNPAEELKARRNGANGAKKIAELVTEYVADLKKRGATSWDQDLYWLNRFIVPAWGAWDVKDVCRQDAKTLITRIGEKTEVTANRVQGVISRLFNYAITEGLAESNPVHKLTLYEEKSRDRVLTAREIKSVWDASAKLLLVWQVFVRLCFLTAQRAGGWNKRQILKGAGEIHLAQWGEFDFDGGFWTIPGERTKNGVAQRVPLTAKVVALLQQLKADQDERGIETPYVFIGERPSRTKGKPAETRKAIYQLREDSGIADLHVHDIRRTVATNLAEGGVPEDPFIKRILNHVDGGNSRAVQNITSIYNRYAYDREKRDALEFWEAKLELIVAGKFAEASKLQFPAWLQTKLAAAESTPAPRTPARARA